MLSFLKNVLNSSNIKANAITTDKDDHQNIENEKITVHSTVTEESSKNDKTMQETKNYFMHRIILHESSSDTEDTNDAEDKTYPCIILTDCMSELNRLKKTTDNSNAHLSDGKRTQRKCAKVAATRISQICGHLDETQARSLEFNRSQNKRLCAKVAENKISEIVNMSSPESDADDESEMSETEMSEIEMSEADRGNDEMSESD